MGAIPDFTEGELWIVRDTLKQRYGKEIAPELAEAELRLDPHSTQLTPCPTLFWQDEESGANFVVFKVGDGRFRSLFYYRIREQYNTGIEEFDNLTECVVTTLQVQADQIAKKREAEADKSD